MSLAISATPERVWMPATAQLLLPGLASSPAAAACGAAKRSAAGNGRVNTVAAPEQAAPGHRESAE